MGHEIDIYDNAVYSKVGAWHGLGLVVQEDMTPRQALTLGGLDITVNDYPIYFRDSFGVEHLVPTNRINVREIAGIDPIQYGVVSSGYHIIQPADVADFATALLEEGKGKVKVESVGSIRNGEKMWLLLKGEEFDVANGDGIFPYILLSNGHDGNTTFRVDPTTVRVVCSNTMHMVIPRFDTGELGRSAISIRHTANVMERLKEAQRALKHYSMALDETKMMARKLVRTDVNSESIKQFFLDCYTADFGIIPENPETKVEENRRNRAMSAFNHFARRFDDEKKLSGASMWTAFNAYSGLVQHDAKARGVDDEDRVAKRIDSNLFGLAQDRTQAALGRAFKMALSA